MKNTFKKSISIPVEFTMTDELETDVVCATEVHIEGLIKQQALYNRFFGPLKGMAKKILVNVDLVKIKLTFVFDNTAKEYPEEIDEQMKFITYSILRPELHLCPIANIESKMIFREPAPNMFYKRNLVMEKMGIPVDSYGVNYTRADDERRVCWQNQALQRGFDDRETWNLSSLSIEWLYSHLARYMEVSIVDMKATTYTFNIMGIEGNTAEVSMTMHEAAGVILDACVDYLTLHDTNCDVEIYTKMMKKMTYALRIWAELFPAFWW